MRHKAKSERRLQQSKQSPIFTSCLPNLWVKSFGSHCLTMEHAIHSFSQQRTLYRRLKVKKCGCLCHHCCSVPHQQSQDMKTNWQEDPRQISSFSVNIFKCFFFFLHIFCATLCFYSQMFLWFQQDSVKSIERKK